MYPWHEVLSSLESRTNLRVDALGLVTMLGADNVDKTVGRLVPSRYLEYLPLLGAFVFAGNSFTSKRAGFQLANLSSDIITGEVAGWLSRWLLSQDFHQIHHRLVWKVADTDAAKDKRGIFTFWVAWVLAFSLNGFLLAFSVLAEDWWGFANVVSMVLSIAVRSVLLQQNRTAIDRAIKNLKEGPGPYAKMLVVLDDSKVITMWAPVNLVRVIFAGNPRVHRVKFYRRIRWIGWVAFATHVVSIGMASLVTQILTVVLMIVSTVLTVFKVGCDDWRVVDRVASVTKRLDPDREIGLESELAITCQISSLLSVSISEYPLGYEMVADTTADVTPSQEKQSVSSSSTPVSDNTGTGESMFQCRGGEDATDLELGLEACPNDGSGNNERTIRRQDLYVWLNLSNDEEESLRRWNLAPRTTARNEDWWTLYRRKQERFRNRFGSQFDS